MYYSAVKNVKEHIDGTLESDTQSATTEKIFTDRLSQKGEIPKPCNSQDLISNSPNCLPYNSYNVSLENLKLDQLIIPQFIFFFILITCLLDIVLIV